MFRQSVTLLDAEVDRPLRADYLVKNPRRQFGTSTIQLCRHRRRLVRPFYSSRASTGVDTVTDLLNKQRRMGVGQSPASRLRELDRMLDTQD